jgi:L-alanine-DL-glutamate epimerase-like enolase superfamily enzyme
MPADTRLHPLDGLRRKPMRITDLRVRLLSYRLKPEEQWPDGDNHVIIWQTTTVAVEVYTDVGLVGIGGGSRYQGPERMRAYAQEVIRPLLLGRNPYDVLSLSAGKAGHGALAIWSAVDTALWDLIARAEGVPLYKLLAVDHDPHPRVPVYASGGEYSWKRGSRWDQPESLIDKALSHKADGYHAFKFRLGGGFNPFGPSMGEYIELLRAIRAAVGPEFGLIQEANCRLSMEQCLQLGPVLDELGFIWFEEPLNRRLPTSVADYLAFKKTLRSVKVSGGETMANRSELAEWVDRGAYDIVQQGCDDAGVIEAWDMARMAHAKGILCCPHNWQCGLVTIANAHLMAGIPNALLLESNMTTNPLKEGLFTERLAVKNGYIDLSDRPGLGYDLRDDLEEQYPYIPGPWNLTEEGLNNDADGAHPVL